MLESSMSTDCDRDLGVGRLEKDCAGLSSGYSSNRTMRPPYGEGRAESADVEAAGEHAHVEGSDGGNI